MNAALNRPALNATILVSVIFHLAVLYYIASAWQILPTTSEPVEPPAIPMTMPVPPPPVVPPDEPIPQKRPMTQPRHVDTPVPTTVDPVPLAPIDRPITEGPVGPIVLDRPIQEQPVSQVVPSYPKPAIEAEKEGRVRLSITIMPDGSVTDVEIVSAQPPGYFERSALEAVKKWRYKSSNTTRRRVLVDIDYELRG